MTRRIRLLLLGLALGIVVLAMGLGPRALRALPGFEVRSVEVTGTRLLAPVEVLRAAEIRAGQSVWDDPASWERALESHPVIESARVTRRLPGTLRVRVEEKRAVAYVEEGSLQPVTASGERLPIDPTRAPADLPIARGTAGRPVPPAVLGEAERLARLDPGLLLEVSEIRSIDGERGVIELRHRQADIILPIGVPTGRLAELRAVLADLDRKLGSGDVRDAALVDLRFADQVIVRLPSSVETP